MTFAYLIRDTCSEAENDSARKRCPVSALPQIAKALLRKPDSRIRASTTAPNSDSSISGAQADVFSKYERDLGLLRGAFPLQTGQSGALFVLGERFCLDYISRPEAFARLYPKLLEGYLLDALEEVDSRPAGDLDAFIAAVAEGALGRRPSAGLGDDIRLHGERSVGSGLELDGELLQLCAFSSENGSERTRIARPSRRG